MTLWTLLLATATWAQSRLPNQTDSMEGPARGVGVGAVVGTPHGLSVAWRPSNAHAVQGAAGWSGQQGRFALNVDYVRTVWVFFNADQSWVLPVYVGAGGRFRTMEADTDRSADQSGFGVRAPIGLRAFPEDVRLDLFVEVAPALAFVPEPAFAIDFGIGVRLWAGEVDD